MLEKYKLAEDRLWWKLNQSVESGSIIPNWVADTEYFWYRRDCGDGFHFMLSNAETADNERAFDHDKICQILSKGLGRKLSQYKLPIIDLEFSKDLDWVTLGAAKKFWRVHRRSGEYQQVSRDIPTPGALLSPNKKFYALAKDNNIEVRSVAGEDLLFATKDGEEQFAYGKPPGASQTEVAQAVAGFQFPTLALWAPNSKRLLVQRIDQRRVPETTIMQFAPPSSSMAPRNIHFRTSRGDSPEREMGYFSIVDLDSKMIAPVSLEPVFISHSSTLELQHAFWSEDSRYLYFLVLSKNHKTATFYEVASATGEIRKVNEEKVDTFFEANLRSDGDAKPNIRVLSKRQEFIWFSERDGWGHLYLHDLRSGEVKKQLTKGAWAVLDIIYCNEESGFLLVLVAGYGNADNPYEQSICRIELDSGAIINLTPEAGHHSCALTPHYLSSALSPQFNWDARGAVSPSGRYIVATTSSHNITPSSYIRSVDGAYAQLLEKGNDRKLANSGFQWPTTFSALGRDGETRIYGLEFRPTHFHPDKKYPLIDVIYGGPQIRYSPKGVFDENNPRDTTTFCYAASLAELGFIVTVIDGFGTPLRSKRFHDHCYDNIEDGGGLKDHALFIQALSKQRSYIDDSRIGVVGHSAGGYAVIRALAEYPSTFKVGVSSAGAHDFLGIIPLWIDKYTSKTTRAEIEKMGNIGIAEKVQGRLLLACGDLDENCPLSVTMRLCAALAAANFDFDLVIRPNKDHNLRGDAFLLKKIWDFFVIHLLGEAPPHEYRLSPSTEASSDAAP